MTMKCAVYEDVVQEFELHQLLVLNIDSLPAEMKQRPDVSFLAWGSELRLHDAGKDGGDGWADLMIVDELGKSWIIEVKLSTSAELNANVWHQLLRYRDSAQKMRWGDIQNYADRFLDGFGRVKPMFSEFNEQHSLVSVVRKWQKILGRSLLPAEDIVGSIASSLRSGTVGLAVIADGYRKSVIEGARKVVHRGDLAYLTVTPASGRLVVASKFIISGEAADYKCSSEVVDEVFYKYRDKRQPKLTASLLEEGLDIEVLGIWREIVQPSLIELGWDRTVAYKAEKGMTLNVNCRGTPAAIIMVGFSSADSSGVDRRFRKQGTFGMRLDFVPWYLKGKFEREDISKQEIESFAERLYELGWRGSGKAFKTAGTGIIPMEVYLGWSYMVYNPSKNCRDFTGRKDDAEKVGAFFCELKRFCQKQLN